uniref:Uncharacterized protein n=1 Tax=Salarias fasciatus TaxID=181472 RepID=A0A672IBV4_SALFA
MKSVNLRKTGVKYNSANRIGLHSALRVFFCSFCRTLNPASYQWTDQNCAPLMVCWSHLEVQQQRLLSCKQTAVHGRPFIQEQDKAKAHTASTAAIPLPWLLSLFSQAQKEKSHSGDHSRAT